MSLDEKISHTGLQDGWIHSEDVKDFIKELKSKAYMHKGFSILSEEWIDKLAGEGLVNG